MTAEQLQDIILFRALNEGAQMSFVDNESANQFSVIIQRQDTTQVSADTPPVTTQVGTGTPPVSANTPPVTPPVEDVEISSLNGTIANMIKLMHGELSKAELMNLLLLKDKKHFKQNILFKSIKSGFIEQTQPQSPNSPTQKYRLTEKGRQLQEYLRTNP